MLIKIIFTLAVIVIVALIFRTKAQPARPRHPIDDDKNSGGVSARFVAYTLQSDAELGINLKDFRIEA